MVGTVVGAESRAEQISRALREVATEAHRRNAALPIVGPDERGAFPPSESGVFGMVVSELARVVADANELRGEVIRTCRAGRTILLTAANTGALRLYLASHVVEEVTEHGARWALEAGVDPAHFMDCWRHEYLPLARVVSDRDLSIDLLGEAERARVENLMSADSDDVPSAILALCLEAFFLSHDRAALEAVYGAGVVLETHRSWLEVLRSPGEAAELGKLIWLSAITPGALVSLAVESGRWIAEKVSPWVLVALALGGAWLVHERASARNWRQLRDGVGTGLLAISDLYIGCVQAQRTFAQASAPRPDWSGLAECLPSEALITRACMTALAADPSGRRSGPQLAGSELARLGIAVTPEMVDRYLGDAGCFRLLDDGLWQLGHPATRQTATLESSVVFD
jgi:predicted nucleic acid-binding protein